jgi:apolipoprotein N-acyltransferase
MQQIVNRVILSWGFQRRLLALIAGAVATFSLAPFHIFPVLFISISVLIWLLDGAAPQVDRPWFLRQLPAFITGWWFGFGYFLAGLWWLGAAFLVDAEVFVWALPIAVLVFPAALALLWGLAAVIARAQWSAGIGRVFALAFAFGTIELVRSLILTGFPWNALGYGLAFNTTMGQGASLVGVAGYSFLTVLIAAAPALIWPVPQPHRTVWAVVAVLPFCIIAAFGYVRLDQAKPVAMNDINIRVVQPNISQKDKWIPENANKILDQLIALSHPPLGESVGTELDATHIIWPESAFPFLVAETPSALLKIDDALAEPTMLISGAARAADQSNADGTRPVFNSVYVFDHNANIVSAYDKSHLVPFGEYLPFENILSKLGLSSLAGSIGGFASGSDNQPWLAAGELDAIMPLICYEVIFSLFAPSENTSQPQLIVNLTNDAWFGRSTGPYQHAHQTQIRSIEEGISTIRAANTGVSFATDGWGQITASIPLNTAGSFTTSVFEPVNQTIYSAFRWRIPALLAILFLAAAQISRFSGRRAKIST